MVTNTVTEGDRLKGNVQVNSAVFNSCASYTNDTIQYTIYKAKNLEDSFNLFEDIQFYHKGRYKLLVFRDKL
jgi:hypothetical protein